MKKQINPTIKAYLIRGAFYLLVLIAVCAIPFALAQRNAAKAVLNPGAGGPQAAPAAAGALRGKLRLPAQRVPTIQTPTTGPKFRILPQPMLPRDILYDQYDNAGSFATSSQDFETSFDSFDDFNADDFVVPSGQTWTISEVDMQGTYDGTPGPAIAFHVFFYQDSGGLPGTQVYAAMNQPYTTSNNIDFVINLSAPAVLGPGTYWVSVQCRMDLGVGGQWFWTDRTVTSNSPAAWQNPGGGFGVGCLTWGVRTSCADDGGAPDQVYRLVGTLGGTPTPTPTASPTPTATATPNQCGTYVTSTGTGTITAGDTDTGSHCDDCSVFISLPFSVSVYGQTFTGANVSSNGALDLIGTESPFTHGCLTLPNSLWEMAILPYQDDLRTDTFSGCSVFPGGNCGVFTSTTGTAPNRQFNIEWRATHFDDTTTSANFEVVFYENDSTHFDVIYGATSDNGSDETSGVQASATGQATTFSCAASTLTNGLKVTYTCAVPTPTPTPPCGNPGAWSFVAPYPETLESAAICTDGTFAYGAGGDLNAFPTAGFYRYDPVADSWTTLASLPLALFDARSAYAANTNKIYVFGGLDVNFNSLNTTYIYDIASDSWTTGAPMPETRFFANVAYYSDNGKIYVIGGFLDIFSLDANQTWEYDPVANTWNTSRTPIPIGLGGSGTTIVCQNIYLAGGFGGVGGTNAHYRYDILTDTWTAMATVPAPVYEPAGGAVGNTTYTMGGGNPFAGGSLAKVKDKQALIRTKIMAPATSYNSAYIYDIGSDTWFIGPQMNDAHSFTGGTAIGNQLLVMAGFNGSSDTNEVEMSAVSDPCTAPCGASPTPTATATATTPPPSATPTATATATETPRPTPTPRPRPTPAPRPHP